MTYCVALLLDRGMIFASDSRTNAGVDQIAIFRKMKIYERPDDRVLVLLCSGNLAVSQAAVNLLDQWGRGPDEAQNLWRARSLFDVANIAGEALRAVQKRDGPYLAQHKIDSTACFIVGGQISGEAPRLFHVYPEGNFIEASPEMPFFQIGETKYGKPIIDRVLTPSMNLRDAAKCVLVSFDSTMRSNISVGLPIDLVCYERDSLAVRLQRHIVEGDPYFSTIHRMWGEGLRRVFSELPNPEWSE